MITLLAVFLVRFGISDRYIYEGGDKKMGQAAASSTIVGPIEDFGTRLPIAGVRSRTQGRSHRSVTITTFMGS